MRLMDAMVVSETHFEVDYVVRAKTEEEARDQANKIAHEQTVELPASYVSETYAEIADHVVGKLVGLEKYTSEEEEDRWKITISYHEDTTGLELPQFLNVVFGNTSIKPGVQVNDFRLSGGLVRAFPGPRFGASGLREACGVEEGEPMVMTALKPMGLSVEELARQTYEFAKGGIDIIKDDHGLANQRWAPFEQRVEACCEAVRRANEETGRRSIYAPTVCGPVEKIFQMAKFAKEKGAGAVLMLPGITGFDSMRALAADDSFGLPILCHPALLGCMLGGSLTPGSLHGFAFDIALCALPQLCGADATIFPNVGGRFGFTLEECQSIVRRSDFSATSAHLSLSLLKLQNIESDSLSLSLSPCSCSQVQEHRGSLQAHRRDSWRWNDPGPNSRDPASPGEGHHSPRGRQRLCQVAELGGERRSLRFLHGQEARPAGDS